MTRAWDRYMTDADKEHLKVWRDRRVGVGKKPALLLIDFYRAVFGDKPEPILDAVKKWPSSCGMAGWNALPHAQRLLGSARDAGIPVIHITLLADAGISGWSEATHRDAVSARSSSDDADALDRKRRGYDIIDEMAPIPGEVVLRKSAPSAFWGTPLVGHLTFLGIDTIFVAGESTSGCVRASVVEGAANRYRMQVVEECVFDRHEAPHALNLFDMHSKYADVISLDDALSYLAHHRRDERRKAESA
jgi:maleamate amidohydrolase